MTLPVEDPLAAFLDALARRGALGRAARAALEGDDLAALDAAMAARDALGPDLAASAAALAGAPAAARAAALVAAREAEADDAALAAALGTARDAVGRELAHLEAGASAAGAYTGDAPRALDVVR